MKPNYRVCAFFSLAVFVVSQAGCLVAAVAYNASKRSQAQSESAEKAQSSTDLRTYDQYRADMERVNLDREKAGLKPNPIMSQEEWISAQTAGRPPIAPNPPAPTPPAAAAPPSDK